MQKSLWYHEDTNTHTHTHTHTTAWDSHTHTHHCLGLTHTHTHTHTHTQLCDDLSEGEPSKSVLNSCWFRGSNGQIPQQLLLSFIGNHFVCMCVRLYVCVYVKVGLHGLKQLMDDA